jgi:hypothetical protein
VVIEWCEWIKRRGNPREVKRMKNGDGDGGVGVQRQRQRRQPQRTQLLCTIGVFVVFLAVVFFPTAHGHSYLDCAKWIPNDARAYTDKSKQRFANADGKCDGYARRFEVGIKPFGKMDEIQFYRHFINLGSNLACRHNGGTSRDRGSNEGRANPVSKAYAPNKETGDVFKKTYGKMAQVRSGDPICWRWPAKNHYGHVNRATNMLNVYWDDVPNRPNELTQAQMQTKLVTKLLFANCPVPGVPSSGDQTGVGSELRPCGGCFTVPPRSPGIYQVQWFWPFHSVTRDPYTSCADIEVLPPRSGSEVTEECLLTPWSEFSQCSADCGGGTSTRTRMVVSMGSGNGTECEATSESVACNTQSCTDALSAHVVYDDALRGMEDWSWSTNYNLTSTDYVHDGNVSIAFTPSGWEAVYFNLPEGGDLAAFQAISFWINGGSAGGQNLQVSMVATGSPTSKPIFQWTIPKSSILPNTWTKVSLTFGSLGLVKGYFNGIWFQAKGSAVQPTVYIDDIYFKHVHQGGTPPQIIDECSTVTCGANAKCIAGACDCINGYGMSETETSSCSIAPSVIGVAVVDMNGDTLTSLDGVDLTLILWNTTGTIDTVNIVLQREDDTSALPIPIATHIINAGEYLWEPPSTLATGTYHVQIEYNNQVTGRGRSLTKTTTLNSMCPSLDCNGHGVCDDDTNGTCVCRYGWSGTTCEIAPADTTRISASVIVSTPYSTVISDSVTFKTLFRTDMAAALLVLSDQIEVTSMSPTKSGSETHVDFDVLMGSNFHPSPWAFTNTTTLSSSLQSMLTTSDSTLNRGVIDFSSVGADDSSSTGAIGTSSSTGTGTTPPPSSTGTTKPMLSVASTTTSSSAMVVVVTTMMTAVIAAAFL